MTDSRSWTNLSNAVYFIIGTEFCERFCFYGMKTILPSYLQFYLGFTENTSIVIFHAFIFFAYITTLLGAILSDTHLGKYKTILYLCIIYCCGNIIMSIGSIFSVLIASISMIISLFLIGLGTGGIKPCVSAFGADQIHNESQLEAYFTLFYFSINAGSTISILLTPLIRDKIHCFGNQNSCYPFAFGLPALLMIIALGFFLFGTTRYKHLDINDSEVRRISIRELWYSMNRSGLENEQYITLTDDQTRSNDIYIVQRIILTLIPVIFFWSLYDQQSSRWVYQGYQMNTQISIFGYEFNILPEQMQLLNAVFVLIMIPLFQHVIYPLIEYYKEKSFTLLERMIAGMGLSCTTFLWTAIVQYYIDLHSTIIDGKCTKECITILFQIPQYILITMSEIMISISGLDFAYSTAPLSLKSLCSSLWLLTVAFGNLFVMIITVLNPFSYLNSKYESYYNYLFYVLIMLLATFSMFRTVRKWNLDEQQYQLQSISSLDDQE